MTRESGQEMHAAQVRAVHVEAQDADRDQVEVVHVV